MEQTDSIKWLQQTVMDMINARGWKPSDRGLAISMALEAAEVLEHFQWEDYEVRQDQDEIAEELADVVIYMLQFMYNRKIDIGKAVVAKLEKSAKRYPVGQTAAQYYGAKLAKRGGAPRQAEAA